MRKLSAPAVISAAVQSTRAPRPPRRWTTRRRVAVATTVAVAAMGAGFATAHPALASWQLATVGNSGVNVRDCYHPTVQLPPSTNCTYQAALSAGTSVHIVCQRAGQNIGGDSVWDYVTYPGGEGFAADYYIYTGYANWIPGIDICS
jgi:hypothetical protein